MNIKFPCCNCGNKLKAPPVLVGRRAKCPRCSHVVTIPKPKADQSPDLTRIVLPPASYALPAAAESKPALSFAPARAVQFAAKDRVFWFGLGSGVAVSLLLWGILAWLTPARAGGESPPAGKPAAPMTVIEIPLETETPPARETTSRPEKEKCGDTSAAPINHAESVSAAPKSTPSTPTSDSESALRESVSADETAVAVLLQLLEKDRPPPASSPLQKSELVNMLVSASPRIKSATFEAGVIRLANMGNLSAAQVLAEWKQEDLLPVLMRLARRGTSAQAEIALDALVRHWPREGAVIFRDALKSNNQSLVRLALRGLGRCECSAAKELIAPFANHSGKDIALAAADALRELSNERFSEGAVSGLAP
jgi:hypothetical protein